MDENLWIQSANSLETYEMKKAKQCGLLMLLPIAAENQADRMILEP